MKEIKIVVRVTVQYDENEDTEQDIKTYLIGNLESAGWKAEIVNDEANT